MKADVYDVDENMFRLGMGRNGPAASTIVASCRMHQLPRRDFSDSAKLTLILEG